MSDRRAVALLLAACTVGCIGPTDIDLHNLSGRSLSAGRSRRDLRPVLPGAHTRLEQTERLFVQHARVVLCYVLPREFFLLPYSSPAVTELNAWGRRSVHVAILPDSTNLFLIDPHTMRAVEPPASLPEFPLGASDDCEAGESEAESPAR